MKQVILLGVNVDHVATLRQMRGGAYPDPVLAALEAELSGADSITVHLREDRRHIQLRDVELLQETLQTRLNLEMAVTEEMLEIALRLKPHSCCFVPEKREELTTEGGLDVAGHQERLRDACGRLQEAGIVVSLFIDPIEKQIEAAKFCGAPWIEIHTGEYAEAKLAQQKQIALSDIMAAALFADNLGLQVNAGHGLHYHNVQAIAEIPQIVELNIGHSIVSRAIFSGFANAVKDMKCLMNQARLRG